MEINKQLLNGICWFSRSLQNIGESTRSWLSCLKSWPDEYQYSLAVLGEGTSPLLLLNHLEMNQCAPHITKACAPMLRTNKMYGILHFKYCTYLKVYVNTYIWRRLCQHNSTGSKPGNCFIILFKVNIGLWQAHNVKQTTLKTYIIRKRQNDEHR